MQIFSQKVKIYYLCDDGDKLGSEYRATISHSPTQNKGERDTKFILLTKTIIFVLKNERQ